MTREKIQQTKSRDGHVLLWLLLVLGGPVMQHLSGLPYDNFWSMLLLAPAALLFGLTIVLTVAVCFAYAWSCWLKARSFQSIKKT